MELNNPILWPFALTGDEILSIISFPPRIRKNISEQFAKVAQLEAENGRLRGFLENELWNFIDDEMPTSDKDTTMLEMIDRELSLGGKQ